MDLKHEQTNFPSENCQFSHLSESSLPSFELNSNPMSPLNLQKTFNFDTKVDPINMFIRKLDFIDLAPKNGIKKPPILKKFPITCPMMSKESIDKFGILKAAQIGVNNQVQNKEICNNCCSLSNQSTDNSMELSKTPIECLNISQNLQMKNLFAASKGIKPSLKNENPIFKLKLPFNNKIENIQNKPFIIKKSNCMNLNNNKKFTDFVQSPESALSKKYNQNEKKIKLSSIFENEFEKIENLGKGHFSAVFKCKHIASGLIYAIKVTKNSIKTVKSSSQILNEVQLLAFFSSCDDNPHIVKYHNSWIEEKELYIQMEYCDNSLENLSKNQIFSEKELLKILKEVCLGLKALHKNKVVHLDIKPENILYVKDKNQYKIADLGLSRVAQLNQGEDIIEGDSRYLARELLNFNESVDLSKADIFSLGASIYELMIRENLPKMDDEWHKIRSGNLKKLENLTQFSLTFKKLIQSMMHPDNEMRPTCEDILNLNIFKNGKEFELKWMKVKSDLIIEEIKRKEKSLKKIELQKKNRNRSI